jgi:hypothetical protein
MTWDQVADRLVQSLAASLARPDISSADKLEAAFQIVAAYGAARLKPLLVERVGTIVQGGPFAGMQFLDRVSEGAYVPKLLGAYEAELHPLIERLAASAYDLVINIGCAEGYYAVGFARRLGAAVHAFDIDEAAQRLCRDLAQRNGVADRVTVGSAFHTADFLRYAGRKVLVICDIEGAEASLLDPSIEPALTTMDILVEMHHVAGHWTSENLFPRFKVSHSIVEIRQQPRDAATYPALDGLSDRERFFALLERLEETRWAFFQAI